MSETWQSFYPDDAEIDAFYAGTSTQAGNIFGCRFFSEGVWRFCLWAPNAKSVSIVGDFNEWDAKSHPMERHRGLWICFIREARQGDNYKYRVEGADGVFVMKADPYAVHAETPPGTASKVWDIGGYSWGDKAWLQKRANTDIFNAPVSIYEVHLGSWRTKEGYEYPSIREVARELAVYVKKMGFTHVELMPINEFPFDGSWGYQVTGFFAVTSRFGTPQDFMYFVDYLHKRGIGVLVDWVPAHFPKDIHGLPHFDGTWLYEHENPVRREHPEWGTYEFNYQRPEVASFLISSAVNLIEQYHIDGIRVDAVSSMLYLDYGRPDGSVKNKDGGNIDLGAVEFIKALNTAVLAKNPGVMSVAEESTAFPYVTKPPYEGGLGFSFKWNMGYMHDTLDFMRSDPYFRHGAHDKMTFSMHYAFSENYILPYSHDEVVHGKASMIGKMFGEYEDKFSALKALYGWLFGHPGKKLMFMGSEFAQFIEWDYKKELDWFLLEYDAHANMLQWVRSLNKLYRGHSALYANDRSWDGFTWLNVSDSKNSVFAFMRAHGTSRMVCVYNFSSQDFAKYDIALPEPGKLKLVLSSSDAKTKKTALAKAQEHNGLPNCATLALPKMSALFYDYLPATV
ncbi:MAG: 1,4-alpha-glucan branching protein GlgB [Coriobacteriales bacterium]|jgi:1,4-alpha-glucan branching enzyme|nr:1,4-alpha-glucan branching protein GlgB [Coriobacteriales bacterium]